MAPKSWLAGVLRVLVQLALQLLDALGHLRHGIFQLRNALHRGLNVQTPGRRLFSKMNKQ
jgi:hypothetical protein